MAHHGGVSENEPAPETPPQTPQPVRQRWHQRTWSLPALVVVALVAVLLGGLGGAALATAGNHQDGRRGFGPGQGFLHGPGGQRGPARGGFGGQRGPGGFGQQRSHVNGPFGSPTPRPTPAPTS